MDLFTELNRVLLEDKTSNTIAMLEVSSPINPPKFSYRFTPPGTKTVVKHHEGGKKEYIRYRKMLRRSATKAFIQNATEFQRNKIENWKGGSDVRNEIICRDAVMNLSMPEKKQWEGEKEQLRQKLTKERDEAQQELDQLTASKSRDPDHIKTIRRLKNTISEVQSELEESRLDFIVRSIPLGLTLNAWHKNDYGSFSGKEIESAINHGYWGVQLYNILRNINDPTLAQHSRDFDGIVAIIIYDMFFDQEIASEQLNRSKVRTEINRNGPKNINIGGQTIKTSQFLLGSGVQRGDMQKPLSHYELMVLLMNGYRVNEIKRELSKQYIEINYVDNKAQSIYGEENNPDDNGDQVITGAINRIWDNRNKYYAMDNVDLDQGRGDGRIRNIRSSWYDPEGLVRDPVVQAQLAQGIIEPDQTLITTKDKSEPRVLWDLPRFAGDNRKRVSDFMQDFRSKQEIPLFFWVTLTGFEGSESKGIKADLQLSKYYGQPVGICPECGGGRLPAKRGDAECSTCDRDWDKPRDVGQTEPLRQKCKKCRGTGKIQTRSGGKLCSKCNGAGKIVERAIGDQSGTVPAWFWANNPRYPAHSNFDKQHKDDDPKTYPDELTPFEKIYQIVYQALKINYEVVMPYDGITNQQYQVGSEGAKMPIPWQIAPPTGQPRPKYAEHVPSYVVLFMVGVTDNLYKGSFEKISRDFERNIKNGFSTAAGDIEDELRRDGFNVSIEPNSNMLIKADKIEVGYSELLGSSSDWKDPDQPSTQFVTDAFDLYRIANFLEKIGKPAPYLWRALSMEHKASVIGMPFPIKTFQECLKISYDHLNRGLSYVEAMILDRNVKKQLSDEESAYVQDLMKRHQREDKSGGGFPGQLKVVTDLVEIINRAHIYNYTFNEKLPSRMIDFMLSQITLQSMYDSHIFGLPKKDDKKKESGKFSKREYIVTIARKIERIIEYTNIQHYEPHNDLYLALGLTYMVPDDVIENNIKSGMYDIVNTDNLDVYAHYLLDQQAVEDSPSSTNPAHVRNALSKIDVELDDIEKLKSFFMAQKPQLAVMHLSSAISSLRNCLKEKKDILDDTDIVFFKGGSRGGMEVGRLKSDPPVGQIVLETEEGDKSFLLRKGSRKGGSPVVLSQGTGASVFQESIRELTKYEISAEYKLADRNLKKRQRAAEVRAKYQIESGSERSDYHTMMSNELDNNLVRIGTELSVKRYFGKTGGKVSLKERAEFDLFIELRDLFVKFLPEAWSARNNFGSLIAIKDKFVKWFNKRNRSYQKYELDLSFLASKDGVNFTSDPELDIKILQEMISELKKVKEGGGFELKGARNAAVAIFSEK